MMSLYDLLRLKFPTASVFDIQLSENTEGVVSINKWNLSVPSPTQSDLDQWAVDLAPNYQFEQNKIANETIYTQLDQIDLKSIRALREGDSTRVTTLENQATALRLQLLPVS